jgi:hypothetical protein
VVRGPQVEKRWSMIYSQVTAVPNYVCLYIHIRNKGLRFSVIIFITVCSSLGRKQRVNEDGACNFRDTVWSAKCAQAFNRSLQITQNTGALCVAEMFISLPTYQTIRCHNPRRLKYISTQL